MKEALLKGELTVFVDSMRRGWKSKKETAGSVSNDTIEAIYRAAEDAGALAGKVSGAGGGGFMFFFAEPTTRPRIAKALSAFAGQVFSCHFTKTGSGLESALKARVSITHGQVA